MKFVVYDKNGNDVTNEREWYVNADGVLCLAINDVDNPIQRAGEEYSHRFVSSCVGCRYEKDMPSHVGCHGCIGMYNDHYTV